MAESVTPYVERTSFSDAIQGALPLIAQRQAQRQALAARQAQMDQQQLQFQQQMELRLLAEQRANAKFIYDTNQDAIKRDNAARESITQPKGKENLNAGEQAAFDFLVTQYNENPEDLPALISQAQGMGTMFTGSHDFLGGQRIEYSDRVFGLKQPGQGMKWVATENDLNAIDERVRQGGFDPNPETMSWDGKQLFVKDIVSSKMVPILQNDFYKQESMSAQYSFAAAQQPLANRTAGTYFGDLQDEIELINDNPDLNKEQKRTAFRNLLENKFADPRTMDDITREAYNTALVEYRPFAGKSKDAQLNEADGTKAIQNYIDKLLGLYNPTQSDQFKVMGVSDFYDRTIKAIYTAVEKNTEATPEEKAIDFRERVSKVVSQDDSQEAVKFRNGLEEGWIEDNPQKKDDVADWKQQAYTDGVNALTGWAIGTSGPFTDTTPDLTVEEKKMTESERRVAAARANAVGSIGAVSDIQFGDEYDRTYGQAPSTNVDFSTEGVRASGFTDISEFSEVLQLTPYLPGKYTQGEPDFGAIDFDDPDAQPEVPIINVTAKPTSMRVLSTDVGYRIELSNFVSVQGTREQLVPIYIDPAIKAGSLRAAFDAEMQKRYDLSVKDIIRIYAGAEKLD